MTDDEAGRFPTMLKPAEVTVRRVREDREIRRDYQAKARKAQESGSSFSHLTFQGRTARKMAQGSIADVRLDRTTGPERH